jgi:hypothetical protein
MSAFTAFWVGLSPLFGLVAAALVALRPFLAAVGGGWRRRLDLLHLWRRFCRITSFFTGFLGGLAADFWTIKGGGGSLAFIKVLFMLYIIFWVGFRGIFYAPHHRPSNSVKVVDMGCG